MEKRGSKNKLRSVPGMDLKAPAKAPNTRTAGRAFKTSGAGHHTLQAHHHEDTGFAKTISEVLEDARNSDHFDRLILCASPEMLGNLRRSLSPIIESTVCGELAKDLVNTPDAELERHFDSMLLS